MEKTLKVYKIGYSNDEAFPTKDTQLLINAFTYNAKRMGDTPTISCTVKCDFIPESEWTEEVYVKFNNERFYLKRAPSSVLDNTDARYKYTLDFVSERNILNNVYFFNIVYGEAAEYKGASNDVNFRFTGDIHEFVKRLNYSLQYSKLQTVTNGFIDGYRVVVDSGVTTEYKDVEFDAQFFSNALQEVFNTYDLPYYFVGKTIHVGHHDNNSTIEELFEYGSEQGLVSITKTSENNKIVNRISGHGSADNIPYYYPNDTPKGAMEFVTPDTNKILQASNFIIANGERVSSTTDFGSNVKFVKYTANSIITNTNISTDGKNLTKYLTYYYFGDELTFDYRYVGYGSNKEEASSKNFLKYESCTKRTHKNRTVEITAHYHVCAKFATTNQDGGVLKWEWKASPYADTIEKQIEKHGNIANEFFKNLKAYEIIDGKEVSITPHQSETYPTSIISTAFSGSKNSDGLSTVQVHLEFDFWKASKSDRGIDTDDILQTAFTKITLETGIEDYYRWENARNSYVSLKDMGISLTPDEVARDFEANKDKYVGEKFSLRQTEYIVPTQTLMPTIYRDSKGKERFYNALNGEYVVPDRFKEEITEEVAPDGKYPFAHPYIEGKPREHMQDFDDIKPTIKGMLNGERERKRMDMFLDVAYDENDNDELDENGKYLHPYFFAQLPKYDGKNGFNLFDHALESGAMQISMTDGWCAGCKFNIAVDPDTQKNVVQVDSFGYLVRDKFGNVVTTGNAQDKQNDTRTNAVWIALEKDTESYGVVMPNKGIKNKPTPNKDTFVILNIALPKAYIIAAEKRLEEELIHYMYNNNTQLFNFSIKFSRIYLAEHPEILQKLNENSSITVVYKGIGYPLHVSSYTYKVYENSILPEITVELSDKLTIATNAIENAVQQAKAEFRTTVASIDYLSNSRNFFIRKDEDDTAIGHLDLEKGFTSNGNANFGKFVAGTQGASVYKDDAGNWYIESDYLHVRKKFSAKSVETEEAHHVGGSQLLTAANCVVDFVKPITDLEGNTIAYRCFFLKEDSSGKGVTNKWKIGDQAYCKSFNLAGKDDGSNSDPDKYYWRKVVATSQDTSEEEMTLTSGDTTIITSNYHFIDLSNKDDEKDVQSDIPYANDNIVQLGYQGTDDVNRQNAIVLAGAGEGSPYIRQYIGIKSFKFTEPDTQIKPGDNKFTGKVTFKNANNEYTDLDKWAQGTESQIKDSVNNIVVGSQNILRNSGFNGDYDVIDLNGDGVLSGDETMLFSPSLKHWDAALATAEELEESASGKSVLFKPYGYIKQKPYIDIAEGAPYVISLKAKGVGAPTVISIDVGGHNRTLQITSNLKYYEDKFTATESNTEFVITSYGNAMVCEIALYLGTTTNRVWAASPFDNRKEKAEFESLGYLKNLLKSDLTWEDGTLSTGVINTGLINMGNYNEEGKFTEVTAGLSGTYNDKHSVAFFGGGDLKKAIYAVSLYRENPHYVPTAKQLENMAKVVITHGGRAILEDAIIRGDIYANNGYFRGIVQAKMIYTDMKWLIGTYSGDYDIDLINEPYTTYHLTPANNDTRKITLPKAEDYLGLELSFIGAPGGGSQFSWMIRGAVIEHGNNYERRQKIAYPAIISNGELKDTTELAIPKDGRMYKFIAVNQMSSSITGPVWLALQQM